MQIEELNVKQIIALMKSDATFRAAFTAWVINRKEHYGRTQTSR